jgi:hypothetical protein
VFDSLSGWSDEAALVPDAADGTLGTAADQPRTEGGTRIMVRMEPQLRRARLEADGGGLENR